MNVKIVIPAIGESITEVTLASWLVSDGDYVKEGDAIAEIESDKATLEMPAEQSGVIKILAEEGAELKIGALIAELDTSIALPTTAVEGKVSAPPSPQISSSPASGGQKNFPSPAARKILEEKGQSESSLTGSGKDGRITKEDALKASAVVGVTKENSAVNGSALPPLPKIAGASREVRREKMTRLRKAIAAKLTEAKNSTAMLTTFNEVDMYELMALRTKYKDQFKEKHEVGLGFMSFFTKAVTMGLREFPQVNAQIDGDELLFHNYADIGMAVSTPKGLVVPVIRNAERMSLADIEKEVRRLAIKGRDGKLSMDEMQGGTFTVTNGGVFGSMLSTPIINIPQSAILGMHNIVDRPVAIKGQVVVHPVMYLALSYDHRIIDGRESVSFLKLIKDLIEDPSRMLLDI